MKKRIPNLDEFINEAKKEVIDITDGVKLEKSKVGSKVTWTLKMSEESYKKISKLFDKYGRPVDRKKLTYNANGSAWTLYSLNYTTFTSASGKEKIKEYVIYGVSGDYKFGQASTYYQARLSGNIKAAKEVYDNFIKDYIK